MEEKISGILENILGFLGLEGSFDIEDREEGLFVSIDTPNAGALIGAGGQTLSALQFIINLIAARQIDNQKRVVIDVAHWRQGKEEELAHKARVWAQEVLESKEIMELEPMPSWQRRIVHMTIQGTEGVKSESAGEGLDRHIVISLDETTES